MAHKKYGLKCKFSPDSKLLVTTSADHTAKLWDVGSHEYVSELTIEGQCSIFCSIYSIFQFLFIFQLLVQFSNFWPHFHFFQFCSIFNLVDFSTIVPIFQIFPHFHFHISISPIFPHFQFFPISNFFSFQFGDFFFICQFLFNFQFGHFFKYCSYFPNFCLIFIFSISPIFLPHFQFFFFFSIFNLFNLFNFLPQFEFCPIFHYLAIFF